jgi:DNA-binding transcriptional LysR family regulator
VLVAPTPFEPAHSTRRFRIATNDYIELVLLPRLLARVWGEAPGVDVRVSNLGSEPNDDLAEDRVDLAIGVTGQFGDPEPPQGVRLKRVLSDRFVCVVREGHPIIKRRLSLDEFVALPHALVAPRGASGSIVDTALARLGKKRRVACEVPHFLVAPHVVRETDLVLTLAERVARSLGPMLGLRQLAPPLALEGFSMSMVWHERQHADAAHAWLRAAIASVAKEL